MTEKHEPDDLAPFGNGGINATGAEAAPPTEEDYSLGGWSGAIQKDWNSGHPGGVAAIEDPPEYNAESGKNPKEGSDWLGGPQNGNETPSSPETTTQEDRGQLKWEEQRSSQAAPSSSDSNPEKSTQNDETWSGRGKEPGQTYGGGLSSTRI